MFFFALARVESAWVTERVVGHTRTFIIYECVERKSGRGPQRGRLNVHRSRTLEIESLWEKRVRRRRPAPPPPFQKTRSPKWTLMFVTFLCADFKVAEWNIKNLSAIKSASAAINSFCYICALRRYYLVAKCATYQLAADKKFSASVRCQI